MIDITSHGHLQCTGQRLEDPFYLMVLILTLGLDIQIHLRSIAEALEEM